MVGCLTGERSADNTPENQTPETSTASTPSPNPAGTPSVSFVGYAIQRSAYYTRHPDFEVVWAPPGRQLLFAMVTVKSGEPTDLSFDDFSLQIGGRTIPEAEGVTGQDGKTYYPRPDECECDSQYETYTTFPLPAPVSAAGGEVRWRGPDETRTWSLPDDALSALSAPSTEWGFSSFAAPDSVGPNESFSISFRARNAGDAAATFRGVLNEAGPMYGISGRWKTRVAPETTIHREQTISTLQELDENVSEVRLRLRTVAGDVDHTVAVE